MKYLKTYESIKDFFTTNPKYIITTGDEKYILYFTKKEYVSILFHVDILNDVDITVFTNSDKEYSEKILNKYLKSDIIYKIDKEFQNPYIDSFQVDIELNNNLLRRRYLEKVGLTPINIEDYNFKIIEFDTGLQRT